jgi:hypothetical protein
MLAHPQKLKSIGKSEQIFHGLKIRVASTTVFLS